MLCGEGGIRTHCRDEPHNGFRDRPIQPRWHLSSLVCVPSISKKPMG